MAIALFLWAVLVALALLEGAGDELFSLAAIGAHVRLLLVIPLFFLCESWVDPRMATFVGTIVQSGVLPQSAQPALATEIARIDRWKASGLAEALCLVAAVLLMLAAPMVQLAGTTMSHEPGRAAAATLYSQWYGLVCLTVFRFLLFRWLWRLALWCHFLWRVSRLPLRLVPTHPDRAAGLGYLEVVHMHFTPLVLAISALEAASLTGELAAGRMAFEAVYPALGVVVAVDALLFVAPLLIFGPKLWACRVKALSDYMCFASRYVDAFDRKWLGEDAARGKDVLGTPEPAVARRPGQQHRHRPPPARGAGEPVAAAGSGDRRGAAVRAPAADGVSRCRTGRAVLHALVGAVTGEPGKRMWLFPRRLAKAGQFKVPYCRGALRMPSTFSWVTGSP